MQSPSTRAGQAMPPWPYAWEQTPETQRPQLAFLSAQSGQVAQPLVKI